MNVSGINIYPVKSLRGIGVPRAKVEDRGFEDDRRFMLVDAEGSLITQREVPKMATLIAENGKGLLEVSTSDGKKIEFSKDFKGLEKATVRVWDSHCEGLIAEDSVNKWFGDALKVDCRLVQMPETTRRQINEKFNNGDDVVSFADGYPFLLLSENSLENLNQKLDRQIPMNRFRPNLVVSGAAAFEEDGWRKIKIGETVLRATKPSARCVVTTIDQKTGISEVREPLKTLAIYRMASDVLPTSFEDFGLKQHDVVFGQNFVAENFGQDIKIGDAVEILK